MLPSSLDALLYLKPKKQFIFIIFFLLVLFVLFGISYFKYTYDVSSYDAFITCEEEKCLLNINVLIADTEKINKGEFLKINNQIYDYKIKKINEIEIDYITMTNYQKIEIETNLNNKLKKENLIMKVSIYANKGRLLRKIAKKFK